MTLPVFRVPQVAGIGTELGLAGAEGRHAVTVRRIRAGEQVVLTDGRGRAATAEVVETGRSSLTARVTAVREDPAPAPRLVVAQAIPKGERGELAVEVLTEIGVDVVVPWAAARCVAVWRGERAEKALARWRTRAHEAAKQSRRTWFPEVTEPVGTTGLAELVARSGLALVLHEEAERPLASVTPPESGDVVLVVGPEGGLTDQEVDLLTGAGGRAVRLGPTVLRTSTAGLAAASALLARTSRWR